MKRKTKKPDMPQPLRQKPSMPDGVDLGPGQLKQPVPESSKKVTLTAEQLTDFRGLSHDLANAVGNIFSSLRTLEDKSQSNDSLRDKSKESKDSILDAYRAYEESRLLFPYGSSDKPVEVSQDTWRKITDSAKQIIEKLTSTETELSELEDSIKDVDGERELKYIQDSAKAATRCLAAVIDGTFKHKLKPESIDVNKFIQDFAGRPILDRQGNPVEVKTRLSKAAVTPINADPVRLRIALDNLVSDAINHRPENPVVIESVRQNGVVSIYVITEKDAEGVVEPIPDNLLSVIGRRVYTTSEPTPEKPFRGFGKLTTRLFCDESNGRFTVENRDGRPCLGMHFQKVKSG